jgi:hypothetical protein
VTQKVYTRAEAAKYILTHSHLHKISSEVNPAEQRLADVFSFWRILEFSPLPRSPL